MNKDDVIDLMIFIGFNKANGHIFKNHVIYYNANADVFVVNGYRKSVKYTYDYLNETFKNTIRKKKIAILLAS